MPDLHERLRKMGETVAAELGFELVMAQLAKERGEWYLRFSLDKPDGIGLDDCERFSRRIEVLLDEADPIPHRYILEVSSAGLDRPLYKEDDYARFAGRRVALKLYQPVNGRRQHAGILLGLVRSDAGAAIELETGDGRLTVPLSQVSKARLELDF